jgi:WD40 repeat protein
MIALYSPVTIGPYLGLIAVRISFTLRLPQDRNPQSGAAKAAPQMTVCRYGMAVMDGPAFHQSIRYRLTTELPECLCARYPLPVSSQGCVMRSQSQLATGPEIRQLAWLNNDQVILAATSAGLYFFDPTDLSARLFFDTNGGVATFTISKDGEWVATADDMGTVSIWNLIDGKQVHELKDKAKGVKSLAFSPDRSALVFSDNDKHIFLWNLKLDQVFGFEKRLSANTNKVMFNDTGDLVISGTESFQVIEWDASSGKLMNQFAADQRINDMSLSSDGKYLALALDVATLQVFDMSTKKVLNLSTIPKSLDSFTFVTYLPSDSNILTGSADGIVRSWNATGSVLLWANTSASQSDHPEIVNPVKALAVSKTGSKLVVGFKDGLVEIWDISTQKREASKALVSIPSIAGILPD